MVDNAMNERDIDRLAESSGHDHERTSGGRASLRLVVRRARAGHAEGAGVRESRPWLFIGNFPIKALIDPYRGRGFQLPGSAQWHLEQTTGYRMVSKELLDILVCPEHRTPLSPADERLLAAVNRAVAAGSLKNRGGDRVEKAIEEGLVRDDRAVLYPVIDGIPIMLVDEAIPLDQVEMGA
jgi:uncharacterized protein YbaR (Trm112 family)